MLSFSTFFFFFFFKGNKLKGLGLVRPLKDKNCPGSVGVGVGSRVPFLPSLP